MVRWNMHRYDNCGVKKWLNASCVCDVVEERKLRNSSNQPGIRARSLQKELLFPSPLLSKSPSLPQTHRQKSFNFSGEPEVKRKMEQIIFPQCISELRIGTGFILSTWALCATKHQLWPENCTGLGSITAQRFQSRTRETSQRSHYTVFGRIVVCVTVSRMECSKVFTLANENVREGEVTGPSSGEHATLEDLDSEEENQRQSTKCLSCQSRRSPSWNGFLGLSLNDRIILFLVILLDKTVSVE